MRNFPNAPKHQVLSDLLKKMRKDAGLFQEELAIRLNRPQSYVSKYEIRERRLDLVDVYLICEALEVPFSTFAKTYEKEVKKL